MFRAPLFTLKTSPVPALAAVILGLGLMGCHKPPPAVEAPPALVTVAAPVPKKLMEWDEFTGRLSAMASVEVRARVSGYLESTHFTEGTEVKKGDLLFVVDPRLYQAQLARAEAEIAGAQTALELATSEAARSERLVESGAVAAEAAIAKTKGRKTAEAALAASKAQADQARLEVEWTRVTAPISGRVGRKLVTEGNLITGGSTGATVLTTIVQLDPIYCYFDVDERSALKYRELAKQGKRESALYHTIPAQMGLANQQGFPHEGLVDFVDNELRPDTGSIQGRAVFDNKDRLMSPGFFARVRIPGTGEYQAMLVRDAAIGSDQGLPFVYVVDAEGKVARRNITTGPLEDGLRIVREGLQAADRVVINGLMSVRPGAVVKAEETKMAPAPAAPTR